MDEKKLFGTTTVGTKGQVVIPVSAREDLGINTGDRLYVVGSGKNGMITLIQENKLEEIIEKMSTHFESIKALKNIKDKEK